MNIKRKLASLQLVKDVQPIKNADRIEVITINGWKVVANKNQYRIGDLVVYCEIDSLLPIKPQYEFLRKSSYIKNIEQEGFRLRTIKLRNQISQGLLLPIQSIIDEFESETCDISKDIKKQIMNSIINNEINVDVTDILGIIKYEKPIPDELKQSILGEIPSFIVKTDEERIQNLVDDFDEIKKLKFSSTEKCDGESSTFYLNEGHFGVCGRNWEFKFNENNPKWKFAVDNNIEEKLRKLGRNIALQGEFLGKGIQGNPYNLDCNIVRFFTIFDIDNYKKLNHDEFIDIIESLELETVPMLERNIDLPDINEIIKNAEGFSLLNPKVKREGKVYVSIDGSISFKVISNSYLIENDND